MNRRGFLAALLAPLVSFPELQPEPEYIDLTEFVEYFRAIYREHLIAMANEWDRQMLEQYKQLGTGWIKVEDFQEPEPTRIGSDFTDAKVRLTEHWRGNNCTRTVGETVIDRVDYQRHPFVKFQTGAKP